MSNARFSIMPARAISDQRMSSAQLRTLAALAIFGDEDGWCFPKLATLGKMLGKSKQAVSMDIKVLVDLGYVQKQPQHRDDGSQRNNLYRILFDTPPLSLAEPPLSSELNPPLSPGLNPPLSPEVDALTPHSNDSFNAPNTYSVFLTSWKEKFPTKTQPQDKTTKLKKAWAARIKDKDFQDGWKEALHNASLSPYLQNKSWFQAEYFLRNDLNWQKVKNFEFDWADKQDYGYKGSDKAKQAGSEIDVDSMTEQEREEYEAWRQDIIRQREERKK